MSPAALLDHRRAVAQIQCRTNHDTSTNIRTRKHEITQSIYTDIVATMDLARAPAARAPRNKVLLLPCSALVRVLCFRGFRTEV